MCEQVCEYEEQVFKDIFIFIFIICILEILLRGGDALKGDPVAEKMGGSANLNSYIVLR